MVWVCEQPNDSDRITPTGVLPSDPSALGPYLLRVMLRHEIHQFTTDLGSIHMYCMCSPELVRVNEQAAPCRVSSNAMAWTPVDVCPAVTRNPSKMPLETSPEIRYQIMVGLRYLHVWEVARNVRDGGEWHPDVTMAAINRSNLSETSDFPGP